MPLKILPRLKLLGYVSLPVIFVIDILVPPGTAMAILYLVSLTLVFNEGKRTIVFFGLVTSVLTITDIIVHYKMDLHYSVFGDRVLTLLAIWIMCYILLKYRNLDEVRRRQQDELLEKERSYHKLVDNLIEGAQIIGHDWKYLYLNNAAENQSGFKREEMLRRTIFDKYPGVENTVLFDVLMKCMKDRTPRVFENEFAYPDGTKNFFKLSVEPIPEGIFILSMDISERKKKEEIQQRYLKELEEMVFITSHKVRQPVAHILGLSHLLDNNAITTEELGTIVGYMKESALALDTFTTELSASLNDSKTRNRV